MIVALNEANSVIFAFLGNMVLCVIPRTEDIVPHQLVTIVLKNRLHINRTLLLQIRMRRMLERLHVSHRTPCTLDQAYWRETVRLRVLRATV